MKILKEQAWVPLIFIILSIILSIIFLSLSAYNPLTPLENILFQIFILVAGIGGSHALGAKSSKEMAQDMIKPRAKSAFRRLISVYSNLQRIATLISGYDKSNEKVAVTVLLQIEQIVIGEITTVDDSMADWHDIIPNEVEELMKTRLKGKVEDHGYKNQSQSG